MVASLVKFDHLCNPLDIVETVMLERDLAFERSEDGDVFTEMPTAWGTHRIGLAWQEDHAYLSITSALENKVPGASFMKVCELLAYVNERLWMGHFSYDTESNSVLFRHSIPASHQEDGLPSAEAVGEILDLAHGEWERFFPALQAVVWGDKTAKDALSFVMFETVGEA